MDNTVTISQHPNPKQARVTTFLPHVHDKPGVYLRFDNGNGVYGLTVDEAEALGKLLIDQANSSRTAFTPQYEHDQGGKFLGRFTYTSPWAKIPLNVDLYYFNDNGFGEPTIMSRWGNTPAENSTGMCFGWSGLSPDLTEARRRAEALGLNVDRRKYHANNMPERGHVVIANGKPHTFRGFATVKSHGKDGVFIKPGYPRSGDQASDNRIIILQDYEEVTDLDGNVIHWCQDI